ncbi:MAG: Rho termination factor N-terminal domain-containing protein, partial [Gammaproteobacteria bacterium]
MSGHAYRRRSSRRRSNNHGGNGNGNGNGLPPDDADVGLLEDEEEEYEDEAAPNGPILSLSELKRKTPTELSELAESVGLEGAARLRKQEMIFAILKAHARNGERICGDGTVEILSDGYGFLRSADSSYQAGADDIYVSHSQIRRFNLRTGDTVSGR